MHQKTPWAILYFAAKSNPNVTKEKNAVSDSILYEKKKPILNENCYTSTA